MPPGSELVTTREGEGGIEECEDNRRHNKQKKKTKIKLKGHEQPTWRLLGISRR